MEQDFPLWLWIGMPFFFAGGWVIGRFFSTAAKRIRALKAEIEQTKAELEETKNQLEQTRMTLEQTRNEAAEYRSQVAQHFSKTADLFNTLTLNYRAVYEHLAISAVNLCDEHVVMLSDGMPNDRILNQTQRGVTPAPELNRKFPPPNQKPPP
jgi:uncharacterized membrane-anchored protein YhcB (DUF1043 family)